MDEVPAAAAAEWEALSDAGKAPYVEKYNKVMEEHEKRVEAYKKIATDGKLLLKKPKWPKIPNQPCIGLSGYSVFMSKNFVKRFLESNKSLQGIEEACIAEWSRMSDDEKAPYMKESEENMEVYKKRRAEGMKMKEDYRKGLLAYYEMKKAAGEEESDHGEWEFTYDSDE